MTCSYKWGSGTVAIEPPLKMTFSGAAHPLPAPENMYKNLGVFLLSTPHCLVGGGAPQDKKKEREKRGEHFQHDFLEF